MEEETTLSKMAQMAGGSSSSERLTATRARSQLGVDATLQGDWKRELAPLWEEARIGQSRERVEYRKGLAKRNDTRAAAR